MSRRQVVLAVLAGSMLIAGSVLPAAHSQGAPAITVAIWSGPEHDALVEAVKAYRAKTGRPVNIEMIARDALQQKVTLDIMTGAGRYDVVYSDSAWTAQFIVAGRLTPFGPYINDASLPKTDLDAKSVGLKAFTYKNEIYGFPSEGDTAFFFYRKDLLAKAGLKVPQTWDEYLAAAKKLTTKNVYGAVIGASRTEAQWDFIHYFFAFGGVWLDENFRPHLNSPEGVAALTFYVDLLRKHKVVPPDSINYGYDGILTALQQGKAAMGIQWMAAEPTLTNQKDSPLVYNKLAYTFPPGRMVGGKLVRHFGGSQWGWIIPKSAKHPKEAFLFVQWLTDVEGGKIWGAHGGTPTNLKVLTDPEVTKKFPRFKLLAQMLPNRFIPPVTTVPQLNDILGKAVHDAAAGAKTPKQALDAAQTETERLLREAGYFK